MVNVLAAGIVWAEPIGPRSVLPLTLPDAWKRPEEKKATAAVNASALRREIEAVLDESIRW
ncbi:hypothetical protein BZM27_00610 [Paraburkholderia steynii]|uniref:Uncharacterized protein n=1 Tax=Paraburkholderia steynii TaxID=1245441 RepID=A0A4R0XPF8_9BURK|nr:hypothetical protein BZM27_00610 [Paraburkholderia steynii]